MVYNADPDSEKTQKLGVLPVVIVEKYELPCNSNKVHLYPIVINNCFFTLQFLNVVVILSYLMKPKFHLLKLDKLFKITG